jgi:hypothetical protein
MFILRIPKSLPKTSELLRGVILMEEKEESSKLNDPSPKKERILPIMDDAYLIIKKSNEKKGK